MPSPRLPTPSCPRNELGLTVRDYEGAMSTLCAGCGHDSITGAIMQAVFELSIPPHRMAKLSGIGCSSKTPAYFRQRLPWLQYGAWPHALGGHGRQRGEPGPALHRRVGRRRYPFHRSRPVPACGPAQPEHAVSDREQRRLWPDKGPVLCLCRRGIEGQEGRDQPAAADRSGTHPAGDRRHLHCAQLLW